MQIGATPSFRSLSPGIVPPQQTQPLGRSFSPQPYGQIPQQRGMSPAYSQNLNFPVTGSFQGRPTATPYNQYGMPSQFTNKNNRYMGAYPGYPQQFASQSPQVMSPYLQMQAPMQYPGISLGPPPLLPGRYQGLPFGVPLNFGSKDHMQPSYVGYQKLGN